MTLKDVRRRLEGSRWLREAPLATLSLLFCLLVLWLDIRTDGDMVEAFLYPLAFVLIYPVRRRWQVLMIATIAIVFTGLGAILEPDVETVEAVIVNRGMTAAVLAGMAWMLLLIGRQQAELVRLATTDELTGIFNRRHFMHLLKREEDRARRYPGRVYSVLILDIDHFKRINDTFGHPVGDEAIRAMAALGARHLRTMDAIGRVGGEEFMILLPENDSSGASMAGERIREAATRAVVAAGEAAVRFTVSVGIATWRPGVTTAALLKAADDALYAAKHAGRNRVCAGEPAIAGPVAPPHAGVVAAAS